MNCSNCGHLNNANSKFCIKCGQSLLNTQPDVPSMEQQVSPVQEPTINNTVNQNSYGVQSNTVSSQTMNVAPRNNVPSVKVSIMEYFFIILSVILKPFTAFKEELHKFNGFKNSIILSVIVSGIATIVNLLSTMLSVVRVKSFDWSTNEVTTSWVWDNLKELKYIEIIGKNFLIYLGVILAIAVVYYLVSLIAKKQVNFSRLLCISSVSVTPLLICYLVLSPLLTLIWSELTTPVIIIGAIYTLVLIYDGMNSEIVLEGNMKYYFNLICLSVLGLAAYYVGKELLISSITDGLGDLDDFMNMFG